MNLESDIEDLLYEYPTTVRVYNALKMYEGIKQIKDLINEDGSFVDNPKYIPNIGKKSVPELRSMRVWFVENYLTLHQENQNQNKNKKAKNKKVKVYFDKQDNEIDVVLINNRKEK